MSGHGLRRMTFEASRDAEYFSASELAKQTGQRARRFGDVVVKELADNALDAAEMAGATPAIGLTALVDGNLLRLSLSDNGSGIRPKDVRRTLVRSQHKQRRTTTASAKKKSAVLRVFLTNSKQP